MVCKCFLHSKAVPLSSLLCMFSGNLCHVTEEQLTTEVRPGIHLTLNATLEAFPLQIEVIFHRNVMYMCTEFFKIQTYSQFQYGRDQVPSLM